MVWQSTDHLCPNCGGQLYDDPTRDILACEECGHGYSEESIREWENGGPVPEPLIESVDGL